MTYKHFVIFMFALLLAACGDASSPNDESPNKEEESLTLDQVPTFPSSMSLATPTPLPIPIRVDDDRFPIQPDPAGQALYEANCASCHGVNGEGQNPKDPYALNEDGLMVAPPHDRTGHTWHHPDQQNFVTVWVGRDAPGALQMPGFSEELTVDEVFQILAYIKTWWGEEELNSQMEQTIATASN